MASIQKKRYNVEPATKPVLNVIDNEIHDNDIHVLIIYEKFS